MEEASKRINIETGHFLNRCIIIFLKNSGKLKFQSLKSYIEIERIIYVYNVTNLIQGLHQNIILH